MRKTIIILGLTICYRMGVFAQTNFYTNVTNLWYQGHKTNVLAIANGRLAQNTNDMAGLILKAEYNFEFYCVDNISNAYLRVIQVGDTITTTNFLKRYGSIRQSYFEILEDLAKNPITEQEIQAEKPKSLLKHKELPANLIEALQKDGYFDTPPE